MGVRPALENVFTAAGRLTYPMNEDSPYKQRMNHQEIGAC